MQVDFPDKNKFLTPEQTFIVMERIRRDHGSAEHEPMTVRKLLGALGDVKLWLYGLLFMSSTMPSYGTGLKRFQSLRFLCSRSSFCLQSSRTSVSTHLHSVLILLPPSHFL